MVNDNVSLKTVEEIWKEIENFGIKREIFKKQNPTYEELRDLYLLITKGKSQLKSKLNKVVK